MPRMPRTLIRLLPHLVLPLVASVGCSNVVGVRTADPKKIQTFAAIGDKPLPTVTGTPGATVVAGVNEPERIPNPRGQISGRVVDADGEPMSNVQVRVAIDGASTGRTGRVTTDEAGRFTLNGLRSGGDYTLIAETEDEQGAFLEGRVVAEAPEKQVRITLKPLEDEEPETRTRIGRVSERTVVDDEPETRSDSPRVNFEDLPPAAAAESIDEPRDGDSEEFSETSSRPTRGAGGWHGHSTAAGTVSAPEDLPPRADRGGDPAPVETPARTQPLAVSDGPNPLPPALERPAPSPAEETFTSLPEQPSGRPTDGFTPPRPPPPLPLQRNRSRNRNQPRPLSPRRRIPPRTPFSRVHQSSPLPRPS